MTSRRTCGTPGSGRDASRRRWMCGLGLGLALLLVPVQADASEMLGKLDCVYLSIESSGEDGRDAGVTPSLLLASLKVGVTENLPRLAINEACENDLYLNVGVVRPIGVDGSAEEYTAVIRLELRRVARVIENESVGMVTVWDASSILVDRGDNASTLISETIRDLAAEFGMEVRRAARP